MFLLTPPFYVVGSCRMQRKRKRSCSSTFLSTCSVPGTSVLCYQVIGQEKWHSNLALTCDRHALLAIATCGVTDKMMWTGLVTGYRSTQYFATWPSKCTGRPAARSKTIVVVVVVIVYCMNSLDPANRKPFTMAIDRLLTAS